MQLMLNTQTSVHFEHGNFPCRGTRLLELTWKRITIKQKKKNNNSKSQWHHRKCQARENFPEGRSVYLLAAQPGGGQKASVRGAVEEHGQQLAVYQGQQGLVARGPHPVPGPVEGVRHRGAQHVVQVHLRHQPEDLQEGEMIEKQDPGGQDSPPNVS